MVDTELHSSPYHFRAIAATTDCKYPYTQTEQVGQAVMINLYYGVVRLRYLASQASDNCELAGDMHNVKFKLSMNP